MWARSEWIAGWAAVFALSGCSAEITPIEVAAGCPDRPERGPARLDDELDELLIDDFEDGAMSLPRVSGRNGVWVIGSDGTFDQLEAIVSDECAGRGQNAGHFVGSGFSRWGANWTAVFRDSGGGTAVPYDATSYLGFSFWAAAGDDVSTPLSLPVGVTSVDVAWNGGVCTECMDYYRTEVTLDRSWRRFEVRFADLAQIGVGDPLVALRLDQLVGVIFWPETDFDVWIDDVRFER